MRVSCWCRVSALEVPITIAWGLGVLTVVASLLGCSSTTPATRVTRRTLPSYYQPGAEVSDPALGDGAGNPSCGNRPYQLFPPNSPWNELVTERAVASDSNAIISYLEAEHSTKYRFQVDFSFVLLEASSNVRAQVFTPTADHYSPDCDLAPVPIVPGGRLEGEQGYACVHNDDCHLLVLAHDECRLYEMWKADIRGEQFSGGCLAVWDLKNVYPPTGRGEFCTSADAAGLPISPLLFSADDIARGQIAHALRFVLPNANIRSRVYVAPGTHSTPATSGPKQAPAYASLFRLRADFDHERMNPAARVVTRALQAYGMYLADAGFLTFTASDDVFTQKKWAEVDFKADDLRELSWGDFEVVDSGPYKPWDGHCVREPITR